MAAGRPAHTLRGMGHLGHIKDEYRALVGRLEAGQVAMPEPRDPRAWQGWKDILEILYSPEEAELASRMPVRPTDIERLAATLAIPAAQLRPRLDAMCDKGLVMDLVHPETGRTKYMLSPPVVGFFEFSMMRAHDSIPKKRMAEALEAYAHGDETFAREVFGHETVIGRAVVHETALSDDARPDVLDWERATSLIEDASALAVSICYCRHKAKHLGSECDAPKEICLSMNAGADFVVRRGFGRAVDRAEALDKVAQARALGLVQIADNVMRKPTYICNCCGCCCGQLQVINDFGLPAVNPSGFVPTWDEAKCKGCSRCSRACPITAITMRPHRVEKKRKNDLRPAIDEERCIGCGVCADTCKNGAMHMKRGAERPDVPRSTIERALRMAIERGRLAHLVFDEGQAPLLHHMLRAILSLPPAQKLLASRQLRSRFVRAVAARVPDPTG